MEKLHAPPQFRINFESTTNRKSLLELVMSVLWKSVVVPSLAIGKACGNHVLTKSCWNLLWCFCLNPTINWKMAGILFLMMLLCLFATTQKVLLLLFSWRIELKKWLKFESASMLMKSWCWKPLKSKSVSILLKDWCWRSLKSKSALMMKAMNWHTNIPMVLHAALVDAVTGIFPPWELLVLLSNH